MHVDTLQTHVVSAIINVDQDVDEPWLLKILGTNSCTRSAGRALTAMCAPGADHSDTEVDLEMAAGDMDLYESAKLLHGRPGERSRDLAMHAVEFLSIF